MRSIVAFATILGVSAFSTNPVDPHLEECFFLAYGDPSLIFRMPGLTGLSPEMDGDPSLIGNIFAGVTLTISDDATGKVVEKPPILGAGNQEILMITEPMCFKRGSYKITTTKPSHHITTTEEQRDSALIPEPVMAAIGAAGSVKYLDPLWWLFPENMRPEAMDNMKANNLPWFFDAPTIAQCSAPVEKSFSVPATVVPAMDRRRLSMEC